MKCIKVESLGDDTDDKTKNCSKPPECENQHNLVEFSHVRAPLHSPRGSFRLIIIVLVCSQIIMSANSVRQIHCHWVNRCAFSRASQTTQTLHSVAKTFSHGFKLGTQMSPFLLIHTSHHERQFLTWFRIFYCIDQHLTKSA